MSERIYKFRAWDKERKEWLEDIMLDGLEGKLLCSEVAYFKGDYVLMQFTGLLDKNGSVELYECDIINVDGHYIGNKYESPSLLEIPTNLVVEGLGTKNWRNTETKALKRGCQYAE